MNEEKQTRPEDESQHPASEAKESYSIAMGLGAVGGGTAGAAIGHSIIGGKVGAAIGGVAGAIAGGIVGNTIAENAEQVIDELQLSSGLGLGADIEPVELPRHYTWEELQALSKPQSREIYNGA